MLSSQAMLRAVLFLTTAVLMRAQAPPIYANFEPSETNPIRLSADGTRLFAVNAANNSLSVFDVTTPTAPKLITEIPVGLGPVSVNSISDDVAWVVNQVSNSISVISVSKGIVTGTLPVKPEPMDVVFANNQAYVTVSRTHQIVVLDLTTAKVVAVIPVFGGNPRALAVAPGGGMVYAAFALSGNVTTIIPNTIAPPQPPPTNPVLPPPPQVGLIVSATDPAWSSVIRFTMPDYDVVAIKTGATPAVAGYYSHVGTINLGLAVNPVTGDLWVANTDARNLTFYVTNLCGHWVDNRVTWIQVANGKVTPFDLNPTVTYGCSVNNTDLAISLAQPTNIVFDPSGSFMYVAAFGTDRVAKVSTNGQVLGFVEVSLPSGSGSKADPANKRGPRGLALHPAAQTLYSLNSIANTISIINTSSFNAVASEIPVGTNPTPAVIQQGRGFLYDAKLSGTGNGSCASCHVDGDMDHLAWNLGNPAGNMTTATQNGVTIQFHPMKGPMTTQTLHGLAGLSPYHWRGDMPDFQAFNAAFPGLMGGNELSTADMNSFTNFVNTILYLPNPSENLDRTYPTSLAGGNPITGQADFITLNLTQPGSVSCNSCHLSNPGPGTNRQYRISTDFSQTFKNAQLRNVYQKLLFDNQPGAQSIDGFGLTFDGSSAGMQQLLAAPIFAMYNAQEGTDMGAFEQCFDTGTAPAVGFTITLTAADISLLQNYWNTLQTQAVAHNIDVVGRGTIQGQKHGLLYQPQSNNYISDTKTTYTQSQLQGFVTAGDTLTIMGVYPGSGTAQY